MKKSKSEIKLEVVGGNTYSSHMPAPAQSKMWCFTFFADETEKPIFIEEMDYLCCGFEKCPTTGNTHYQSWTLFKNKVSFKKAKELICISCYNKACHIEASRGTAEQNDKYCKKDGLFFFLVISRNKGHVRTLIT